MVRNKDTTTMFQNATSFVSQSAEQFRAVTDGSPYLKGARASQVPSGLHSLVKSPRRYSRLWSKELPMDGEVIIAQLIDSAETYIGDWKYAVAYDNNPDKVSLTASAKDKLAAAIRKCLIEPKGSLQREFLRNKVGMRFFVRKSNNWVQARVGTIEETSHKKTSAVSIQSGGIYMMGIFGGVRRETNQLRFTLKSTEDFCRHVVRVKSFEQSHDIFIAIASLPMEDRGYLHQAKFQGYLKAVQTAWLDVIAKGHPLKVSKKHLRILWETIIQPSAEHFGSLRNLRKRKVSYIGTTELEDREVSATCDSDHGDSER